MRKRYDDYKHMYLDAKGKLIPGIYTVNGYQYWVDFHGRTIRVIGVGKLRKGKRKSLSIPMNIIGQRDELPDDDRGHILADVLAGINTKINLIPQNGKLNRGEYKAFEMYLVQLILKSNNTISIDISIMYPLNSHRPSCIIYDVLVNGVKYIKKEFYND